ncbi:acetaldehyde dehydrogenase (acetylating) [uncultured Arthrobacter sp.]|nr:acetaldehyde dehydrogenase (acetylating) [uncultured Arthrobacter sp.]
MTGIHGASTNSTKVAVIGSGNIGTDLTVKVERFSEHLEMAALVGIDAQSDGLSRAQGMGITTISNGVQGLIDMDGFDEVELILDATSAGAHRLNAKALAPYAKRMIDLTPAAVGPFVVPAVNLVAHVDAPNVNMVTCGGQATIPIVAAVAAVLPVSYAEIVASVSSRSAGPGTRANIDEFTETTARAVEQVGGAARGKAVIILNPAEPPMIMRDTVYCLIPDGDLDAVRASIHDMVSAVAAYVPGYRLKQAVQFTEVKRNEMSTLTSDCVRWKVTVFLEVEGAAHYLPAYAGNLKSLSRSLDASRRTRHDGGHA